MLGLGLQIPQTAPVGEIDQLINLLLARATYSENLPETYRLLTDLISC
jgi:hypothetical protein